MKYLQITVLTLIILLASILRLYKVTEIPPSLNWDEISIGYNAYSVLKTGSDEWGEFLPIHFKAYGEYKLPVQIYLSIPGIAIFGLNEFGVRITPAVYGTLTVLVIFFLGKNIFKNSQAGLIASFLLAISPWHIHLTRASFESSFATFWVSLGMWFLIRGFEKRKNFLYSVVFFAISVFTYNAARIFSPLFLFTTGVIYRKELVKIKKMVIVSTALFIILLLPLVPFLLSGDRSARYKLVSITDDPGLIPRINENRGNSMLPYPFSSLVHNKITYISFYFAKNYFAHFTPQFLFISGAPHKQHHVQNMGQLYLFQAPFLLIGLIALLLFKQKYKGIIFAWLFLSYIPVSVTGDSIPHALRTLIAVPVYQLVSGYGLLIAINWLKKKSKIISYFVFLILAIIIIFELGRYLQNYYQIYPKLYSRDWQYGYKQVVEYVNEHKDEYDLIVFTRHYGEPHMFTLFFSKFAPGKYQTDLNLIRFETYDWVRVLKFDKYYFPDLGDEGTKYKDILTQNEGKKLLFVGKNEDFPVEKHKLKTIYLLNGDPVFEIVEDK